MHPEIPLQYFHGILVTAGIMRMYGFAFALAAAAATCFLAAALSTQPDTAVPLGVPSADGSNAPFKVLFTGFGPFLNFTTNPTMIMALALQQEPCHTVSIVPKPSAAFDLEQTHVQHTAGAQHVTASQPATVPIQICFDAYVLPVNRTGAQWTTQFLQQQLASGHVPYDLVLHTGLEDFAKGLKLETAATNQQANDTGGPSTQPAVPGGAELLPTTVNLGWMSLAVLKAAGTTPNTTELWSRNAGDYYCNEVFYRTLNFIRSKGVFAGATGAFLPAMFVHAPNETTDSILQDIAVIKQVAAHALWSTYMAPGAAAGPPAKKADNEDVSLNRGALAMLLLGCFVAGAGAVALFLCVCKQCCESPGAHAGRQRSLDGPYVVVRDDEVPTPVTARAPQV